MKKKFTAKNIGIFLVFLFLAIQSFRIDKTIEPVNPATDFISINLNGIETAAIKIVDVLGNTVFKDSYFSGVKKVDVSNFKNGIYFVMIESNGIKTMTRKVVIKH